MGDGESDWQSFDDACRYCGGPLEGKVTTYTAFGPVYMWRHRDSQVRDCPSTTCAAPYDELKLHKTEGTTNE